MKPSLQLRLSRQLTLTPQLQQSIRLLQMSTLELNQELEQIIGENPLLERDDDPLAASLRLAPNGGLDTYGPSGDASGEGESTGAEARGSDSGAAAGEDGERGEPGDWSGEPSGRSRPDEGDEPDYPQLAAAAEGLHEHLLAQLAGTRCSPRDRALVELLIEEVGEDGYLETPLAEIHALLPDELEVDPDELAAALRLLQSFDPPGVGAADLRESLLLQLRYDDRAATWAVPVVELARAIVDAYLNLLAARDFVRLRRALRCDDDALRAAQELIRSLSPRPGAAFGSTASGYVVPDVLVRRTRGGWSVTLNPEVMPKLRVNSLYADILRRNRGGNGRLSGQLQEARWLIKNVQQRFDTILRVSQAIVERQKAFFSHGEVAMRPLVLREIADTLGLHESTVSRVTTQKYMLTPHGTYELKYFFGSHVATDSGGAASSTAIRALIKQLVAAEDSRTPLSDSQIAETLGQQGIVVARRTIAKYRESLMIPPVSQRKAL